MMLIRYSIILLISTLAIKSCGQEKQDTEVKELEYIAQTRGAFLRIAITPDSLVVQKDRATVEAAETPVESRDWNILLGYVRDMDLDQLESFEAPTSGRETDRAMMAELHIHTSEKVYSTVTFDHGTPPKELEPLISRMLEMGKSVEGQ